MKRWERIASDWLADAGTASFVDSQTLASIFEGSRKAGGIEATTPDRSSFVRWRLALEQSGVVARVKRDLYANLAKQPRPHPEEASALIRPGAIVSLQSVLGVHGVINNPSRTIFAIVPLSDVAATGKRIFDTPFGEFAFTAMRDEVLYAGELEDRLDASVPYPRATPEKALCDWLYYASNSRRNAYELPPSDSDIDSLDQARLARLAQEMQVADALDRWAENLAGKENSHGF